MKEKRQKREENVLNGIGDEREDSGVEDGIGGGDEARKGDRMEGEEEKNAIEDVEA